MIVPIVFNEAYNMQRNRQLLNFMLRGPQRVALKVQVNTAISAPRVSQFIEGLSKSCSAIDADNDDGTASLLYHIFTSYCAFSRKNIGALPPRVGVCITLPEALLAVVSVLLTSDNCVLQ